MSKTRGTRVWVAVDRTGRPLVYMTRMLRKLVRDCIVREIVNGSTASYAIRRATLVPDPEKPKKPAKRRRPA